jgi:hypothetical protein
MSQPSQGAVSDAVGCHVSSTSPTDLPCLNGELVVLHVGKSGEDVGDGLVTLLEILLALQDAYVWDNRLENLGVVQRKILMAKYVDAGCQSNSRMY